MTKRRISNTIDRLEERYGLDTDSGPMLLNVAGIHPPKGKARADIDDASHPELVIKRWPEQKPDDLSVAVPKLLPERYRTLRTLIVESCDGVQVTRDDTSGAKGAAAVKACELWEELSDKELRKEYDIRVANGDPIPEMLADHVGDDRDD